MTRTKRLLASASGVALAVLGASAAQAAGTTAGSTITNNVTLNYKVGGVDQTEVKASDTFTVDRKVNLNVAEEGTTTTSVSPGQKSAVTSFLVTNTSNAPLDLALAATQAGVSAAHGGTDNFDATNVRIFLDTNDNGTFDTGTDTLVTYLDQIAADVTRRVFVLADVPIGSKTNDVAAVRLSATAAEATAAGSLGATIVQTSGANTAGVDTVFADTNTAGNTARDGIHFAVDDYTVSAAAITATKTSRVISDPINNTTDPKMIPGSVVEYCIAVSNAAGSATATNLAISDALPTETTYLSSFGVLVGGTVTGSTCNADGSNSGAHANGTVSGSLASLAAGATRTVLFRVTLN
ncbi:MAG TPA: hypothetical protein VF628_03630 [Allosphingosinicella sp.]|jgi:uncharacterized repeat protein (TIGR01451 family)